jgi:GNAT superfamily N-acetyltransferase
MTAALTQSHLAATKRGDGLSRTSFGRDLYQIAELIELCFAPGMDSSGHAAVQEMKFVARFWPLTWLLMLLDHPGTGIGYVWRIDGRVIGNVSLYPGGSHQWLGQGWLVANVAVHPELRRQGIAQAMMHASLDLARSRDERWVALQVEADNSAAQELYKQLGFATYETLLVWERTGFHRPSPLAGIDTWPVRRRHPGEATAEADLILNRARPGAMTWGQPIDRSQFGDGLLSNLGSLLSGQAQDRWVMPDPAHPKRLAGALWGDSSGWRSARLSLFLDPALHDPCGRQALLQVILDNPAFEEWSLRLETVSGDLLIEEILSTAGFRKIRALTQMRHQFVMRDE